MKIKKIASILAVTTVLVGVFSTSAFAGGHHRNNSSRYYAPECSVENCDAGYGHYHDGDYYSGHHNDNHTSNYTHHGGRHH